MATEDQGNFHPLVWDKPGIRRGVVNLGQAPVGTRPAPLSLIGAAGSWNCCDVYASVPVGWLGVPLTLSLEVEGIQVDVDTRTLGESRYQSDGTTIQALIFSLRGHPAKAFAVRGVAPFAPANAGPGRMNMVCWGQDTAGDQPELGPRPYSSVALDDRDIIEPAPCHLRQIVALNNDVALRYLHLFDRITVPPNGTVPIWTPLPIGSNQIGSQSWHKPGYRFVTGLVWASSSTPATLTVAAAQMWVSASRTSP